jgi:diguanylate cyclase (GGDEF)-like protein/PAS domain S-box-containing protein
MTLPDRFALLEQILAILPVGVWIADENGRIVYSNPAAQRAWGGARCTRIEQLRGWSVATGKPIAPGEWAAARALREGATSLDQEIEIEGFDGRRRILLDSAMPLRDAQGRIVGAVIVNHDITERKRTEQKLQEMAEHDALTGAHNRRYLFRFLESEIERARRYGAPLSLVMFDIDRFKDVNDAHGHLVGDRVLVQLCEIVSQELRSADRLARYGGEEFVIVTPGIARDQAAVLAERQRGRIASARFDDAGPITCSFGVCQYENGNADDLIRRADDLLYAAKRAGRNRVAVG